MCAPHGVMNYACRQRLLKTSLAAGVVRALEVRRALLLRCMKRLQAADGKTLSAVLRSERPLRLLCCPLSSYSGWQSVGDIKQIAGKTDVTVGREPSSGKDNSQESLNGCINEPGSLTMLKISPLSCYTGPLSIRSLCQSTSRSLINTNLTTELC